jgi:hypothetical protein
VSDLLGWLLFPCAFVAYGAYLECRHERERREWARERQRLMEYARPGLQLLEEETPPILRAFGTDEDEWRIEQRRRGQG